MVFVDKKPKVEIDIPANSSSELQLVVSFDDTLPEQRCRPLFKVAVPPDAKQCIIWVVENAKS